MKYFTICFQLTMSPVMSFLSESISPCAKSIRLFVFYSLLGSMSDRPFYCIRLRPINIAANSLWCACGFDLDAFIISMPSSSLLHPLFRYVSQDRQLITVYNSRMASFLLRSELSDSFRRMCAREKWKRWRKKERER